MTLPGSPPAPAGFLHLLTRTIREIEDVFVGLGYRVMEGPEVELDYYNFTALNHPPGHPARMAQDTFYVDPATLSPDLRIAPQEPGPPSGEALPPGPEDVVLRTHTSPMQVRAMETQPPPIFIVVPGRCYRSDPFDATHSPVFHQIEGLAVGTDITLADLLGTLSEFARAIFGPEREIRFRPGFFPFTEPSVEVDVSCFACGGTGQARGRLARLDLQGHRLDRDPRLGDGRPERVRLRQAQRLRPRRGPGVRLRDGDRADRDAEARDPRPAQVLRERRPRPGAVPMRSVPVGWLSEYCDPGLSAEELADALNLKSTEVERISHAGAPSPDGFVVGEVISVEQHPDADRLSVCEVDTGDGEADDRLRRPERRRRPARPGGAARRRAARTGPEARQGEAARRRARRDDPVGDRARDRRRLRRASWSWRTARSRAPPLSEVLAVSQPVLELEVNSNRVDCFGVYGVAREVHAITEAKLADPPWDEDAEASGEGKAEDYASVEVQVPELCPRFTARVFTDVTIGPSPLWLKERLMAAGQRPINNVVDITNYVMLLTAQPLHAFDLDKVPDGALIIRTAEKGEKMTTLDGVERSFDAETVLVCDREGPSGIAGIMGGARSEVSEAHHQGAAGGRELERRQHPPHLAQARAALGGLEPVREAAAPRARDLGPAGRLAADGRALRREAGARHDRRRRRDPAGRTRSSCAASGSRSCSGCRSSPPRRRPTWSGSASRRRRKKGEVDGDGPVPPPLRRQPGGRPDRGGRAGSTASTGCPRRCRSPTRGGLTREQRLRRRAEDVMRDLGFDNVLNLSLTEPGLPAPAADPRGRARLRADHGPQPALGRALRAAHLAARVAARLRRLQPRAGRRPGGAVRVGPRLSAGGATSFGGRAPEAASSRGSARRRRSSRTGSPASPSGRCARPGWRDEPVPADFFAVKGALEALCRAARRRARGRARRAPVPALRAGPAWAVLDGRPAGWIGEIHPLVLRDLGDRGARRRLRARPGRADRRVERRATSATGT